MLPPKVVLGSVHQPDLQRVAILLFVPQVVEAKHEKLGGVVRKVFSRMGTIAEDGLTHPFDQTTGLTKGFAFVNFLNPQDAKQAAATLNGWQLDKSHNIKVRVENLYFAVLESILLAKNIMKKAQEQTLHQRRSEARATWRCHMTPHPAVTTTAVLT